MSFLKKLFGNSPKIMDWREFTEYFARQGKEALGGGSEIEWGKSLEDTTVILTPPDQIEYRSYLGNLYAEYKQNPEDLDAIMQNAWEPMKQLRDSLNATVRSDDILPLIKHLCFFEQIAENSRNDGIDPNNDQCSRPLAGDIALIYMVNLGGNLRSVSIDELAAVGINDEETLYQTALNNLRQLDSPIQIVRSDNNSLTQIILDSAYNASLLLVLDDILRAAELTLPDYPVAAIPARDTLLVCASQDQEAVSQLQQLAAQIATESPYSISTELYAVKNGEIQLFQALN